MPARRPATVLDWILSRRNRGLRVLGQFKSVYLTYHSPMGLTVRRVVQTAELERTNPGWRWALAQHLRAMRAATRKPF
jgi:hypothetical protein